MNDTQTKLLQENVIRTASALFLKKGIRALKMDDVAAAMKMSKRTLYQLFSDKASLLEACIQKRYEENDAWMQEIVSHTDDVMEVILRHAEIMLKTINSLPQGFLEEMAHYPNLDLLRQKRHKEQEQQAVAFMQRGVEQGVLRPEINYQLLYEALNSFITSTSRQNSTLSAYKPINIVMSVFVPLLRGCTTQAGRERLDNFEIKLTKNSAL
ncbi:MAG: TetR/AcrR family transcriptional regulator [Alloprevotella sp.]|nr:TetR/AcrR family transcriptional regulator [Alloprevotella sp.]MBR6338981.1 TetR/AcrR family transcriptional regulator [Alloprevotella sp.]